MLLTNKFFTTTALATGLALVSPISSATIYPSFTVDQTNIQNVSNGGVISNAITDAFNVTTAESIFPGQTVGSVLANQINGDYNEIVNITGAHSFSTDILFVGTSLTLSGASAQYAGLEGSGAAGAVTYGIFATFSGNGSISSVISGSTVTNTFTIAGGAFNLYLDPNANINNNTLNSGTIANNGNVKPTITSEDLLLATNSVNPAVSGLGQQTLNVSNGQCTNGGNNDCGSFGFNTNLALTTLGSEIFTSPVPFFNLAINSGGFTAVSTTTESLVQNASSVIDFTVPEPASLALLGVGMLGLGFKSRKTLK